PLRARSDQAAARVPRGDIRGGAAARSTPDRVLRAPACPGFHGLLSRLSRSRHRAGRGRRLAARAVGGGAANDRALPGPARGGWTPGVVAVLPRRLSSVHLLLRPSVRPPRICLT